MIHQTFTGDYLDLSKVVAISRVTLEPNDTTPNKPFKVCSVFKVFFTSYHFKFYSTPFTSERLKEFEGINEIIEEENKKLLPTIEAWKKLKQP